MKKKDYIFWNGIKFINKKQISFEKDILSAKLITVPSAPVLLETHSNHLLYGALKNADFSIIDSSLFAILCRLYRLQINKFSGFLLIYSLLEYLSTKKIKVLLVDPSNEIGKLNRAYLLSNTLLNEDDIINYTAPFFHKENLIEDNTLLQIIIKEKPEIIILGIAGGKQELLGNFLKCNLSLKFTILCTGAALSFFTGAQAPINRTIDKMHLGWLFRIIYNPKSFMPRYINAFKLVYIFFKSPINY